jgi:hypothetical protein
MPAGIYRRVAAINAALPKTPREEIRPELIKNEKTVPV